MSRRRHDIDPRSAPPRTAPGSVVRRYRAARIVSFAAALALSLAACGADGGRPSASSPATVARVDSLVLAESDTSYIGRPVGLAVSPGGDYFVIDGFRPRVLRYDRQGTLVAQIGQSGEGPGEFLAPSGLAFLSETELAVIDFRGNRISLFDQRSGAYHRRRPFEGSYRAISGGRDSLWLGLWNERLGTAVALWSVSNDSLTNLVPIPDVYVAGSVRRMLLDNTLVSAFGDSLLVGFAGQERLLVTSRAGETVATFRVPVVRRRGVPEDVEQRMRGAASLEAAVRESSYLLALNRLASGAVVVVHADMELKGKVYLMDVMVSLVRADLRTACADAPLPLARDAQPWIAFAGDTIVVLEQVVVDPDRTKSIIRRFTLDDCSCDWRSTDYESRPR